MQLKQNTLKSVKFEKNKGSKEEELDSTCFIIEIWNNINFEANEILLHSSSKASKNLNTRKSFT